MASIRNVVSSLLRNDQSYVHVLQHLFLTEVYWWQWLVYGKDAQGRPLFSDRLLDEETLRAAQERHTSILPLKEKRYFNTFATPQLTRKMRMQSGIEKLEIPEDPIDNETVCKDKVVALEAPLGLEERNGLLWKYLRAARAKVWLELGGKISPEEITRKEIAIEGISGQDSDIVAHNADTHSEIEDGQYSPSEELPKGEDGNLPSKKNQQAEFTSEDVEAQERPKRLLEGDEEEEQLAKRAKLVEGNS